LPPLAAQVLAAQVRQHQVQQDQGKSPGPRRFTSLETVHDFGYLETVELQEVSQTHADLFLVFHNQNGRSKLH